MKSLEFATKVFTRVVIEQLEILKSTSLLVQTLSIPSLVAPAFYLTRS